MMNINSKGFINSKEIYDYLEIKSRYNDWINNNLTFIEGRLNIDFYYNFSKSTGGRKAREVYISIDTAKEIALLSRSEKGKQLRRWLISLGNKHESGLAFTSEQIMSLIELSKSMTLISIQKEVEKKHFALYNDKYTWFEYRANLLGYSTNKLIEAMQAVNKKHKSIRKSLIHLDACELIRTGVIDFMIALGKSEEYATNTGNLCKEMALKMELGNQIWDDTKPNPLKLNQYKINQLQENFNNQLK